LKLETFEVLIRVEVGGVGIFMLMGDREHFMTSTPMKVDSRILPMVQIVLANLIVFEQRFHRKLD
jgi:hypothetical protein